MAEAQPTIDIAWLAQRRPSLHKGSYLLLFEKKKKWGVVTIPETLFVRGKGINQGSEEHI
jgi:hypothetical protein